MIINLIWAVKTWASAVFLWLQAALATKPFLFFCNEDIGYDGDDGYPAYSHHDKIPPWWEYVSNDKGGNVSVSKSHHTW